MRELAIRIKGNTFIVARDKDEHSDDEYVALFEKKAGLVIMDYFSIKFSRNKKSFKVYEKKKGRKKEFIGEVVIQGEFKRIRHDLKYPHFIFYLAKIDKIEIINALDSN